MINPPELTQALENDYEAQQLNDFYNQEDKNIKIEKLKEIRKNYYLQQNILKTKLKEKQKCL